MAGPSIKEILRNLSELDDILPSESFPFNEYLQSIKEVHKMCITNVFDENYEILINEFECIFYKGPRDLEKYKSSE